MTVGSKVKQTYANLKGIEGTLNIYSAQCRNEEEREVYKKALETIEVISLDVENRLKVLEREEPQYKGN